jgi:hypothetical protein
MGGEPLCGTTAVLETLGNLGDFLGGLGVIITLVYLSFQIRQNSRLVEQSMVLAQAQALREGDLTQPSMLTIAQDPELSKIFRAGLASYKGLSDDDKIRFNLAFGCLVGAFTMNYAQQVTLGLLDDGRISSQVASLKGFLGPPGGREWWEIFGSQYSDDFQEFVREHVFDCSSPGPAA